jgi:hypothetical protein
MSDGGGGGDDDFERDRSEDDDGNGDGWADHELGKRSALRATIDQIELDDDYPRALQPVAVLGNANAVRPEEQVVDNTAYYNLVSLWTSLYIRTKEGFALPLVFDARTQHMVHSKRTRFDF